MLLEYDLKKLMNYSNAKEYVLLNCNQLVSYIVEVPSNEASIDR